MSHSLTPQEVEDILKEAVAIKSTRKRSPYPAKLWELIMKIAPTMELQSLALALGMRSDHLQRKLRKLNGIEAPTDGVKFINLGSSNPVISLVGESQRSAPLTIDFHCRGIPIKIQVSDQGRGVDWKSLFEGIASAGGLHS